MIRLKKDSQVLLILALLILCKPLYSANTSINYFEEQARHPAKIHFVKSSYYDHKIIVQLPNSYEDKVYKKYPVIYLLDGDRNIKSLISNITALVERNKIPEIIIVAIPVGQTRQQDYTPNDLFMHSSKSKGNSDRFSSLLSNNIFPYVESHFRTHPYRILSGHSRGGLFAFNDLLRNENLFNAYFAFSPALWVNDYELIKRAEANLKDNVVGKRFLYINAGGDEGANIKLAYQSIEKVINRNKAIAPNWYTVFHDEDSHGTTPIPGHYLALRKLYSDWDKPWEVYETEGFDGVKKQYEMLSVHYGYKVIPDENVLNTLGYHLLDEKSIEKAITAFRLNTQYYPESANAYDSYAEGLMLNDQFKLALDVINKAIILLNNRQGQQADLIRSRAKMIRELNK